MSVISIRGTRKSYMQEYRENPPTATIEAIARIIQLTTWASKHGGQDINPMEVAEVKKTYDSVNGNLYDENIVFIKKRIGGIKFDYLDVVITILFSDEDHNHTWFTSKNPKPVIWKTLEDIPLGFGLFPAEMIQVVHES